MVASKADIMLTRAPVASGAEDHIEVGCPSSYVLVADENTVDSGVDIDMAATRTLRLCFAKCSRIEEGKGSQRCLFPPACETRRPYRRPTVGSRGFELCMWMVVVKVN